ncbi:hypothetical protein [Niallia sp. Krafla_26]|uniref:hypothetical protein n=1 Tax=Niallia sp. Krafla_26 TaxID=3064703 RepID=UPI003D180CFA
MRAYQGQKAIKSQEKVHDGASQGQKALKSQEKVHDGASQGQKTVKNQKKVLECFNKTKIKNIEECLQIKTQVILWTTIRFSSI